MENIKLTDASLKLFLFYAEDAGNWAGTPYLNGNRTFTKEDRGNLTQLKKAGLLRTSGPGNSAFIIFNDSARALAREHGIPVCF